MKKAVAAVVAAIAAISAAVAAGASSPAVGTGSVNHVGDHAAVLHGVVNPNGGSTAYFFEWGLTPAYGVNGRPLSAGRGVRPVPVAEAAGGLIPGTVYHYRLVAINRYGTTAGTDRAFRTAGHPPAVVSTGPASAINRTGATLTGAVNPEGAATTWWYEWGTTPSFGQQTTPQVLPANAPATNVAGSLQGVLAPGTIYYYALVASHSGGVISSGGTGSFMTFPLPRPVVRISAATGPKHPRHRPYLLVTVGSIAGPSWMPSTYACAGIVTIRFFSGRHEVGFTVAGVQPNCTFGAFTPFARLPGRKPHPPVHLRIVVRYVSTPYLGTSRARLGHVTLG